MFTDHIRTDGVEAGLFGRIVNALKGAATAYAVSADEVRNAEAGFTHAHITGEAADRERILVQREARRARREIRLG